MYAYAAILATLPGRSSCTHLSVHSHRGTYASYRGHFSPDSVVFSYTMCSEHVREAHHEGVPLASPEHVTEEPHDPSLLY